MEKRASSYIYEFGGSKNGYFRRNIYVAQDESFLQKKDSICKEYHNKDIYRSAFSWEAPDQEDSLIYGDMYLDFDADITDEESYKKLSFQVRLAINYLLLYLKLKKESIDIYFSGGKGFHIIVPAECLGVEPENKLNERYKTFAKKIKNECGISAIDLAIYDKRRLFRIPNTINSKRNKYKIQITIDEIYKLSWDELQELANNPRDIHDIVREYQPQAAKFFQSIVDVPIKTASKKEIIIPTESRELLPCTIKLLEQGVTKGGRNNAAVILASSLLQSGMDEDSVLETVSNWNQLNDPPLEEREIVTVCRSAKAMAESGRAYGCASYKEIDMCVGSACELLGERHGRQ